MAFNQLIEDIKNSKSFFSFSKIKDEEIEEALLWAIQVGKDKIQKILNEKETNFKNTIEALEFHSEELSQANMYLYNSISVRRNNKLQDTVEKMSPQISLFENEVVLNKELFKKVKTIFDQKDQLGLKDEEKRLTEKTYEYFILNGSHLSDEEKKELKEIDQKLSSLSSQFGNNLVKASSHFQLEVENEKDLSGIPDRVKKEAYLLAEKKGKKNRWIFNLQAPSYTPFMMYCENRDLRKKMSMAYQTRCFNDSFDNQKIVLELVHLRQKRAKLLKYPTHAHWTLKTRMLDHPQKVNSFLNELLIKSKKKCTEEMKELESFARKQGFQDKLQAWDLSFYLEKLKKEKFQMDDESLRAYFPLEESLKGLFAVIKKLYQIQFKEVKNIDTYHEEVRTYKITDLKGNLISYLYLDLFPRENKSGGAWMTNYKEQGMFRGTNVRPHIGVVCNLTRPSKDADSLLSYYELTTLFHEFGHALHGMFSNCMYQSLSGTNVKYDFVELPSQILENWAKEKESLDLFAKHHKTKESISQDMIDKLKKISQFFSGYSSLRQLNFSFLDMAWHQTEEKISDVYEFEKKATQKTKIFESDEKTCMSCSFSHIFDGGYSAGYYSYKWSELLSCDAFEVFKEEGVFNQKTAKRFKESILSQGDRKDPMLLYKDFRKKEPQIESLFKKEGFIS